MNRQQRRRNKGTISQATAQVIETRAIQGAVSALLASVAVVMHDKHGWGRVRVDRLLNQIQDQFECVTAGTVSLQDLRDVAEAELGIKLTNE